MTTQTQLNSPDHPTRFDGSAYSPKFDFGRLTGQMRRVYDYMSGGQWCTLGEIADYTFAPESSVSAQLRNLRKERFGGYTVNKRSRGDRRDGLWEYQVLGSETKTGKGE